MSNTMRATALIAVFAAIIPTALAAHNTVHTCGELTDADCANTAGTEFVLSRRDGEQCQVPGAACVVNVPNQGDHGLCCMSVLQRFDCSDQFEGAPIQVLGTRQNDDPNDVPTSWRVAFLRIDRTAQHGDYTTLFEIQPVITTPPLFHINACGINDADQLMYCYLEVEVNTGTMDQFVGRVAADGVHFVAKIDDFENASNPASNPNMRYQIYSGTIDNYGSWITFRPGGAATTGTIPGTYYRIENIASLPGFREPSDCANAATVSATWLQNLPADSAQHADIVHLNGVDIDDTGPADWVLGLGNSANGFDDVGMLTKTSGVDAGRYYKLALVFDDPATAPNAGALQNWGAGWNYYNNVAFADNNGAGVFLGRRIYVDDASDPNNSGGRIEMSLVSESAENRFNDGGNCGPPAQIPFATCSYKYAEGPDPVTDQDCGAGWSATPETAMTRHVVCGYDSVIGCTVGSDGDTDQVQCCDRDCSGFCDGHGVGFTDEDDAPCSCTCNTGYAGSTDANCDQCAVGYAGYPNCAPEIYIDSTLVVEGNVAELNVTLSVPSLNAISVSWATADGVASAPADYAAGASTITFAPGVSWVIISIQTNTDIVGDSDETFDVVLSSPVGAVIGVGVGVVTIIDIPGVSVENAVVQEGQAAQVRITLTHAVPAPASVVWTDAPGSATVVNGDYDPETGTITFAPGQTEVIVQFQTTFDSITEGTEEFTVTLSGTGSSAFVLVSPGTVTIMDTPEVSINSVSVLEGGAATLTVTLSGASLLSTSVAWSTVDGTAVQPGDYVANSAVVTFAAGQTSATITIQTTYRSEIEATEAFTCVLSGAVGLVISGGTGTVTIIDTPEVSINSVSVFEGGAATLTVTLSGASSQFTTVAWSTVDGTAVQPGDYTGAGGAVTFATGETTATITIQTTVDGVFENNEAFTCVLGGATGLVISEGTGTVTIIDTPTITIGSTVTTEGETAVVPVCISHVVSEVVTVSFVTDDGTAQAPDDYVAGSGVLTWAPGEICVSVAVPTLVNEDDDASGEEGFTIVISSPAGAGATIAQGTGAVVISEVELPTISINELTLVSEGETAVVPVCISTASSETVSVSWTTISGTAMSSTGDFAAGSGVLTWAPGVLCINIPVTTLVNVDDDDTDREEQFTIVCSLPEGATVSRGTGVVLIRQPTISVSGNTIVPEGTPAVVPVCMSHVSGETVSASWSTVDGTASSSTGDYVATSGVLTWAPGVLCVDVTVPTLINVDDDDAVNPYGRVTGGTGEEGFTIVIGNPSGATIGTSGTGTVVITEPVNPYGRVTGGNGGANGMGGGNTYGVGGGNIGANGMGGGNTYGSGNRHGGEGGKAGKGKAGSSKGGKGKAGSGKGGKGGKGKGGEGGFGAMNSESTLASGTSTGLVIAACVFLVAGLGLMTVRQQQERSGYTLAPSDETTAWLPSNPDERTPLNLVIEEAQPVIV